MRAFNPSQPICAGRTPFRGPCSIGVGFPLGATEFFPAMGTVTLAAVAVRTSVGHGTVLAGAFTWTSGDQQVTAENTTDFTGGGLTAVGAGVAINPAQRVSMLPLSAGRALGSGHAFGPVSSSNVGTVIVKLARQELTLTNALVQDRTV